MEPTVSNELKVLTEEIGTVSAIITRVQHRLADLMRRTDIETGALKDKITDIKEAKKNVKWLEHRHAELERESARYRPELENAVKARNASQRRLRYAHKVIRDLVNENEKLRAIINGAPEGEDIQELRNAVIEAVDEDSSDSDSETTARPPSEGSAAGQFSPLSMVGMESAPSPVILAELLTSVSRARGSLEPSWELHWTKPPRSSEKSFGPMTSEKLIRLLGFREGQVARLARLADPSLDPCVRIEIIEDFVFVYDPIFLESKSKQTYIIDWGLEETNQSLENFFAGRHAPFHLFTFPLSQDAWFYVGEHMCKVSRVRGIWPTLNAKSRTRIAEKVVARSMARLQNQTIVDALDSGGLQQICIEISGKGFEELTAVFSRELGFRSPQN